MINAAAMKPFGLAIADYYRGDKKAMVMIHREDGIVDKLEISSFFRKSTAFPMDKVALDNCRGRVLDVGAGVGIHSLYLQEKDFDVCAMDVSPEACDVARKLGVKNVRCTSFNDFIDKPYDTLLILGRSICMVETLKGLAGFLTDARRLVKPGGQIILNSLDVTQTDNPRNLAYHKANRKAGRYEGEVRVCMEYKSIKAPFTGLLHVDGTSLAVYAAGANWACHVSTQENNGNYLARLIKKD
jgi:SAM-dependent methyltransferase